MGILVPSAQILSIGGNDLSRITSVEMDADIEIIRQAIVDGTWEEIASGYSTGNLTVTQAIQQADTAIMGYLDIGDTGAIIWQPNGVTVTYLKMTSTESIVSSQRASAPVNGFFSVTSTIALVDVTWAAN